jgi:hypothetical protein
MNTRIPHRRGIETRYLGPTDYPWPGGSRIRALLADSDDRDDPTTTVDYDQSIDSQGNHDRAALALLLKLRRDGWRVRLVHATATTRGYVYATAHLED